MRNTCMRSGGGVILGGGIGISVASAIGSKIEVK